MVVRTEICMYTEYKIYPGKGQKLVGRDMKTTHVITAKAMSLHRQKIKPVKLTWTQAWRRMNKKGKVDQGGRRKNKKTMKVQKAIVGMSLDDIKRKKREAMTQRSERVDQAKKEAQRRFQNKGSAGAKATKPKPQQQKAQMQQKNVTKNQKQTKAKNFNTKK